MKLIIHAGTHKTATTSLQHFFTLNRSVLRKHGFFYPRNRSSSYVFNFLASDIAFGKVLKTKAFLDKARADALRKNCHTVLISAESFYAMTGFFIDIPARKTENQNYWDSEASFIQQLKSCCEGYDERQIVFYVRPQDEFASSLYNQLVKNVFGISDSYSDFLKIGAPVLDYKKHVDLWENIFGREQVSVCNFTDIQSDPISDFCSRFLSEACYQEANRKNLQSNTRLTRDLLEYKRSFNACEYDPSLRYIAMRGLTLLNERYPDSEGYQLFQTAQERRQFFKIFEDGNSALAERYCIKNLPTMRNEQDPGYPGLSKDTELKIEHDLQLFLKKPLNQILLSGRRVANIVMHKLPGGHILMQPLRVFIHRFRLLAQGW